MNWPAFFASTDSSFKNLVGDRIAPTLDGLDMQGAIIRLAELLAPDVGLDAPLLADEMWSRELMLPTLTPEGIALPRARLTPVKKVAAALGIAPSGIRYEGASAGRRPIQIMLAIAAPADPGLDLVGAIGIAMRTLGQPEVRGELLRAGDKMSVKSVIERGSA